ncbi:MAG: hypothetical protein EXR02_03820 [Rhodospirillales bacterium]|nr:hypothetical protein [Rhodospirillales bacterium]MSP80180.1 hypothetical protein [Rhodospirillales bacterium]
MSARTEGRSLEVVGHFASHTAFARAVEALTGAGFALGDLSVLSTHESLDAAPRDPGRTRWSRSPARSSTRRRWSPPAR